MDISEKKIGKEMFCIFTQGMTNSTEHDNCPSKLCLGEGYRKVMSYEMAEDNELKENCSQDKDEVKIVSFMRSNLGNQG